MKLKRRAETLWCQLVFRDKYHSRCTNSCLQEVPPHAYLQCKLHVTRHSGQQLVRCQGDNAATCRAVTTTWLGEFRFVPKQGVPLNWTPAFSPEGFLTEGMALSAAILQGRLAVDESTNADGHSR